MSSNETPIRKMDTIVRGDGGLSGSTAPDPELVRLLRGLAPEELPPPDTNKNVDLTFCFDGGGSAIVVGAKAYLVVDMPCRINGWTIYADQTGSIVFTVSSGLYTDASLVDITAGFKPGLSGARKNFGNLTDVSAWDKDVIPDKTQTPPSRVVCASVDSASTVQVVTLAIKALRLDL